MLEEMKSNPDLVEEYDDTFDSEEKLVHSLKLDKDAFTLRLGVVKFCDIGFTEPKRVSRKDTYLGLSKSIAELGILEPIHVMISETFGDWIESGNSEEDFDPDMPKYLVLAGFRRIYAGYKNGLDRCNAVIWNFKDKSKGSELSTIISLVLDKQQRRSWGEIWYLYEILELQSTMSPGTLEYLLQLESGDAMKLKDIMLCDYNDIKEELLSNKKTLTQCYNMLQKARKDEDKLLEEDTKGGISSIDETEGIIDSRSEDDRVLSDEEVQEILEMGENYDIELDASDFDESANNSPDDRQTVGNRHPLDPDLKARTLKRDEYKCQCCGFGEGLPMTYALSILQSHHKISVANSGRDRDNNIITVCQNCHTLIHTLLKNSMKFGGSFDTLSDENKEILTNIMRVARIDYEAGKRLGKNKDDFRKDNKDNMKFKMPGTDLAENRKALEESAS